MGYIEQNLLPEERLLYVARLSPFALARPLILGGLALVIAFLAGWEGVRDFFAVVGLLLLGSAWLRWLGTEMAVTDRRVILKRGVFRIDTLAFFLYKVNSVEVRQTLTGRMLNFGDIRLTDSAGEREYVHNIADPIQFRQQFMMATDRRPSTPQPLGT